MAIHLPIKPLKTRAGFGADTEMRTQYLPAHLADDITTAPSEPVPPPPPLEIFCMHHLKDRIAHTMTFVTLVRTNNRCDKGRGIYYHVYGMVHIKYH